MIDTQRLSLRLSIETLVLSCLVTCLESISHFTVAKEHASRLSCNLIEAGARIQAGSKLAGKKQKPGLLFGHIRY